MQHNDASNWEARIARLERRNRRLTALVTVLVLVLVGWAGWQWRAARNADPFAPVITRAFILLDEDGNQRAVFSSDESRTSLQMRDPVGRNRAVLDVTPLGPGLTLNDSYGAVRALLTVGDESPYFGLTDEEGNDLIILPETIYETGGSSNSAGG